MRKLIKTGTSSNKKNQSYKSNSAEDAEDAYYALAVKELEDNNYSKNLYGRAIVESDGNELKVIAKYIELRVAELKNKSCAGKTNDTINNSQIKEKTLLYTILDVIGAIVIGFLVICAIAMILVLVS